MIEKFWYAVFVNHLIDSAIAFKNENLTPDDLISGWKKRFTIDLDVSMINLAKHISFAYNSGIIT